VANSACIKDGVQAVFILEVPWVGAGDLGSGRVSGQKIR